MNYLTTASSPSSPISTTFDFDATDFSLPSLSSPSPAFRPFPSSHTAVPNSSFIWTQVSSSSFQSQPGSIRFDQPSVDFQSHGLPGLRPNTGPSPPTWESAHIRTTAMPSLLSNDPYILTNATHDTLLQSGNRAHTELYRAYLQVQAEIQGLKYAYTTLATTSQASTTMGVTGLTAGHTTGPSLSLQLASSQPPPQSPLSKEDYPSVKYWHAISWANSKTNRNTDIFTTSPKPKKKGSFWYLEDANGAPLNEERCNAVTKRARQIFSHLNASGGGATKWGDMGNVSQDYYRREMYSFFPELRLCELDWKVNRLATETYSSWYRKRKDKLAITVKHESHDIAEDPRGVFLQRKRPQTPLQQLPYPKKAKSSDLTQPPVPPSACPVASCPQPTPVRNSVVASTPTVATTSTRMPVLPAQAAQLSPSPEYPPTSCPQPTPHNTSAPQPIPHRTSPTSVPEQTPHVASPSIRVLPSPSLPSPARPPNSRPRPTPCWASVPLNPPTATPSTTVLLSDPAQASRASHSLPSPTSSHTAATNLNPALALSSMPSPSLTDSNSCRRLRSPVPSIGPDRPAAAPQEPELGVHDGQTLDSLETPSAPAQEEEEEPEEEEVTITAVEGMDASKKYGWDLQEGSESTTQAKITVVDPLDESGSSRLGAVPARVSRIAGARAAHAPSGNTKIDAIRTTEKPPEAKKATKMRPTKSTTARNLYAIFYMKEHPNATTAEFSTAFKNLDKSTLLLYEEKSKNLKMAGTGSG